MRLPDITRTVSARSIALIHSAGCERTKTTVMPIKMQEVSGLFQSLRVDDFLSGMRTNAAQRFSRLARGIKTDEKSRRCKYLECVLIVHVEMIAERVENGAQGVEGESKQWLEK